MHLRGLASRPLAIAGGVLLLAAVGATYAPAPLLIPCGLVLVAGAARLGRASPILLVAALAGLKGGWELRTTEARVRASPLRARSPPRLAHAILLVERCGEDPVRERAWLVGRTAEGSGLLCSWPGRLPDRVGRGARVRVAGRLNVPRGPTNPGERDRAASFARDGIVARLYLGEPENLELLEPGGSPIARWIRVVRRRGARALMDALPPRDAGLAMALLFGWRAGITDRDRLRFERTGTLHLLAISGLHLLLVAGAVHAIGRAIGLGPRAAAACTLATCLLYVPIAGAGAPVRRAAAVLVVYGVALARGRLPDAASALGGAVCVVVLQDPGEVGRIGFWLSFAAAAGIALHARRWRDRWGARHRLLVRFPAIQEDRRWRLRIESHLLAALPVSLAAWCATAPLIARQFGLVTPWAPLTNLAAAPFVTLLMPINFAIACGVEPLAPIATALCTGLRATLDCFDRVPAACVSVPPPTVVALGVWYVGLLLLAHRAAIGIPLLAISLLLAWPSRTPREPTMTILDVGHGQAILLQDRRGRAALIDGGSRNRHRVGAYVLRPALRARGIAELDLVVCTHADADHWNGITELLGRIPIVCIAVGPEPPLPGVPARTGDILWDADGIRIRVADDGRDMPDATRNDRSLALLVELDGARVLLPADRETEGLRRLLRHDLARCDVLVAPHHGSANEAAAELGARVRPTWLLVSTGPDFADPATLNAYGARHVRRTDRDGALVVAASHGDVVSLSAIPIRLVEAD
ncbi:MAG: ComEC/Rec2 family competence protein [Planctomycetota bacterium]